MHTCWDISGLVSGGGDATKRGLYGSFCIEFMKIKTKDSYICGRLSMTSSLGFVVGGDKGRTLSI